MQEVEPMPPNKPLLTDGARSLVPRQRAPRQSGKSLCSPK